MASTPSGGGIIHYSLTGVMAARGCKKGMGAMGTRTGRTAWIVWLLGGGLLVQTALGATPMNGFCSGHDPADCCTRAGLETAPGASCLSTGCAACAMTLSGHRLVPHSSEEEGKPAHPSSFSLPLRAAPLPWHPPI